MKIGELYFSYKMENVEKEVDGQTLKGWLATESFSPTGSMVVGVLPVNWLFTQM